MVDIIAQNENYDVKASDQNSNHDVKIEDKLSKKMNSGSDLVSEGVNTLEEKTDDSFTSLNISEPLLESISRMGLVNMTPIQKEAIPAAFTGADILAAAKTGSGKTLAFLIPTIEILYKLYFKPSLGTGAIILSPTRELALQTTRVLKDLLFHFNITFSIVMGGASRFLEQQKLTKGSNIVVATPVIDEADRILDCGFELELKEIIKILPKDRQTLLFSATQTTKVDEIARASLRSKKPVLIDVNKGGQTSTAEGLEQGYVICESDMKFLILYTFLKKQLKNKKKIIVFMASCKAVKYMSEVLNFLNIPVVPLHGQLKQTKRTNTFFEFINKEYGTLVCTNIAARGLDIPAIDWILQYDPADDPKDYIHRAGRTARAGKTGKSLSFLLPSEKLYLNYLKQYKVPIKEYDFPKDKLLDIQAYLEKLVYTNQELYKAAVDAYKSYLLAYTSFSLKAVFDVNRLDLEKVAKSFGLREVPSISISRN